MINRRENIREIETKEIKGQGGKNKKNGKKERKFSILNFMNMDFA